MELRARQRTGSRVFGVVFKIGDLIANRYRVNDIIGSGGAGVVYRAHDQEIDVDVAVKVINAKLVQTADEQRLFSRQTKIARKLSHQNVVRIYDEGRDEDRPFYTMQFLEGLSLRKIIDLRKEKQQTFALAEIEPIYNQLCQALDYAHKTTFHGDLKPDNVLVLPDLLKVTDFALLRGLPRKPFLAIQKSRAQNFRYLAPEVRLEVNELDRQVDMYSLGIILCEMLTGMVYDDAKPDSLSVSGTGVDTSILSVMKRALARAPKDRYLAATELYEDLRSVAVKGGTARNVRVPPTSGQPPHLAEMPTQRLDLARHGARPTPAESEESTKDSRPKPVEVAASIAVPDSQHLEPAQELSGTFATIDDDMIESAAPSSAQESAKSPAPAHAPAPLAAQASTEDLKTPLLSRPSAELDASAEEEMPDFGPDDSETEAVMSHHAPALAQAAAAAASKPAEKEKSGDPLGSTEAALQDLVEISNSAIELIADPRATNVIRVEPSGEVEYRGKLTVEPRRSQPPLPEGDEPLTSDAPVNRTQQPIPLPDSALPQPAFANPAAAREPTAHGRLDAPEGSPEAPIPLPASNMPAMTPSLPPPPVAPQVVVRGSPAGDAGAAAAGGAVAEKPRTIPRSPTLAMEESPPPPANGSTKHKNGKSVKARPMTRPRMSAVVAGAFAEPVVLPQPEPLTPSALFEPTPSPEILRQPTGARPLVIDSGSIRPQDSVPQMQAVAPAPPANSNRALILTIVLSVLSLMIALVIVFKVQADQQAKQINELHAQMLAMQNLAKSAKEREESATAEAKDRAVAADEAAKAAADAARLASEAEKKKGEAEAAAKKREDEAKRLEEEAKKAQDEKKRAEAKKAAEVATAEAVKQRQAADAEAKREKDERAREEREKKRREKEEQAQKLAEERAQREREAKTRAEEKAAKLAAEREAKAEAARDKREEDKRRADEAKAAAEEKKKEEAARAEEKKKKDEEAKAAAEEAKKSKKEEESEAAGGAMAAAAGSGGKNCPKGMALIEAGAFMMGAPGNDPERNFGDLPYASVDVRAYCIDYYEFPNGLKHLPSGSTNFKSALAQCKKKQKRLCTEAEWEKACKGPSGSRFPYGNQWDPTACATEDDEGNKREMQGSGEFKRCRSGYNVFDLSGNVAEWTATEYGAGGYVVKGGAADRPGYDGRCAARKKKKATDADAMLGFRCCADPS